MIFKSEIHRPSSAKLWQIPHPAALPIAPLLCEREVPLEAQDTSNRFRRDMGGVEEAYAEMMKRIGLA